MQKYDMVLQIAEETGLKQQDVKRVLQLTLDGIIKVLISEGRIELRNFGVFKVKQRRPRTARNPRTGETVHVPSRKAVTFKPGKLMTQQVRDGSSEG